jgi:O-antigen ligase
MSTNRRKQRSVAMLAYRPTNMRVVFVSVVTSLVTALGILVFGAAPIAMLCVLLWLGVFVGSHSLFLVLLWFAILLYQVIFPEQFLGQLGNSFTSLPIMLLPMDPAYFFTTVYLIINAVTQPQKFYRAVRENLLLCLFLVIIIVSTIMYTSLYGKMAIGEARKSFFYFVFPLLTALSIKKPRDLRWLIGAVFIIAICVSMQGYLRFIVDHFIRRAITAEGALILVLTVFSIFIIHMNSMVVVNRPVDIILLCIFLPVIVLTQHRTVFLGGAFGLLLMFSLHRKKMLFLAKALLVSIAFLTVMAVVFINNPVFENSFTGALHGITDPHSDETGSWRMEGWRQQLNGLSAKELLFGKGLGSYYRWFNRGVEIKAGPHNTYVMIILKLGLLGLVAYGFLVFSFFRKIFAVRNELPPGPMRAYLEMSILNFGAAHVYMTGYDFSLIMLIFYAMGTSAVQLSQNVHRVAGQHEQGAYQNLHCYFGSSSSQRKPQAFPSFGSFS